MPKYYDQDRFEIPEEDLPNFTGKIYDEDRFEVLKEDVVKPISQTPLPTVDAPEANIAKGGTGDIPAFKSKVAQEWDKQENAIKLDMASRSTGPALMNVPINFFREIGTMAGGIPLTLYGLSTGKITPSEAMSAATMGVAADLKAQLTELPYPGKEGGTDINYAEAYPLSTALTVIPPLRLALGGLTAIAKKLGKIPTPRRGSKIIGAFGYGDKISDTALDGFKLEKNTIKDFGAYNTKDISDAIRLLGNDELERFKSNIKTTKEAYDYILESRKGPHYFATGISETTGNRLPDIGNKGILGAIERQITATKWVTILHPTKGPMSIEKNIASQMEKAGIAWNDNGIYKPTNNMPIKPSVEKQLVSAWKGLVLTNPGWLFGNVVGNLQFGIMQGGLKGLAPTSYPKSAGRLIDSLNMSWNKEAGLPKIVASTLTSEGLDIPVVNVKQSALKRIFVDPVYKSIQKGIIDAWSKGKPIASIGESLKYVSGALGGGAAGFALGGIPGLAGGLAIGVLGVPYIPAMNDFMERVARTNSYLLALEKNYEPMIRNGSLPDKVSYDLLKRGVKGADILKGIQDGTIPKNKVLDAAREVDTFFYDYSKSSKQTQDFIRTAFPFWSFMEHSTQLLNKYPDLRPGMSAAYAIEMRNINRDLDKDMVAVTELGIMPVDQVKKIQEKVGSVDKSIPSYMLGDIPIKFTYKDEEYILPTGYFNPFALQAETAFNIAKAIREGSISGNEFASITKQSGLAGGSPGMQFLNMLQNINTFTGKQFTMPPSKDYGTTSYGKTSPVGTEKEFKAGITPLEAILRTGLPGYGKARSILKAGDKYTGTSLWDPYYGSVRTAIPNAKDIISDIQAIEDRNRSISQKAAALRTLTPFRIQAIKEIPVEAKTVRTYLDKEIAINTEKLQRRDISADERMEAEYMLIIYKNILRSLKGK